MAADGSQFGFPFPRTPLRAIAQANLDAVIPLRAAA